MNDVNEQQPIQKKLSGKSKGNSKAVLIKRVEFDTTPAQKAIEKDHNVLQGHSFRINYMAEIIANQNDTHDQVEQTNKTLHEYLDKAITHIKKEQERLAVLIEQNGLDEEDMRHDNPVRYELELSTPVAQRLIRLYQEYDELIKKSDFLYLNGIFEPKQAQQLQYDYKRVIEKAGGRIRDLALKLNKAQHLATANSKKPGNEEVSEAVEVENTAPEAESDKEPVHADEQASGA